MNYAAAFLAFILLAATVFWYIGGKSYYSGPIIEAQAEDTDSQHAVDIAHELGTKDEKAANIAHELGTDEKDGYKV
jgi:hypothetical protein